MVVLCDVVVARPARVYRVWSGPVVERCRARALSGAARVEGAVVVDQEDRVLFAHVLIVIVVFYVVLLMMMMMMIVIAVAAAADYPLATAASAPWPSW